MPTSPCYWLKSIFVWNVYFDCWSLLESRVLFLVKIVAWNWFSSSFCTFFISDALLADLQNSVPGQQNSLNQYTGQNGSATSGYGSLRPKPPPAQSVSVQQMYQKFSSNSKFITFYRQQTSPYLEARKVITEQSKTPGSQYSQKTTHYNNQNGNTGNLSELDTLLQDLSAARYGSNLVSKSGKSSLGSQNQLNDSIKRPSVDDLLEELSNAQAAGPLYAVPNRSV